ncbi:UNVERIFIED_CONTAM: hypothetical protein FKN15_040978 [Acipenser sinensis]
MGRMAFSRSPAFLCPSPFYLSKSLAWDTHCISPRTLVCTVQVKYDFLFDVHYTCCQEVWPRPQQRQAYTTALLVLVFLVPMATMGVLYGKIISELWGKHRVRDVMFQTLPCSEINKITRKKRRAVKMMVVVVLLFAFCWTPFHLVSILTDYGKLWLPPEQELLLFTAVQLLGFSNSVCNPVVYAALNDNFKKRVLCLLLQRGAKMRREGRLGGPGARVGISTVESPRVGERTERSMLGAGRLSSRTAWEPQTSASFPPVHLFRAAPKQHSAPLMLSVTDPLTLPAAAP